MRKAAPFLLSVVLLAVLVTPPFAMVDAQVEPSRSLMKEAKPIRVGEPNPNGGSDKRMGDFQERAEKEITRRITTLQNLSGRLEEVKSLTDEEKTAVDAEIQKEIIALTTLQAKIKATTDPVNLKTELQSIVTLHRTYALVMPKISILVAADRMGDTADKLSLIASQLQTKLGEAKSQGKDVTSSVTILTTMQKKIADATIQEQNAVNAVLPLTPEGYPGNKTQLEAARGMLKLGYQDLLGARQDIKSLINELK